MGKKLAASLLLLAGCMVGPRYCPPEEEFAPQFTEQEPAQGELNEWWAQFEDPILNGMVDEAIANNYDLKIASARIAEVRANYNFAWAQLWPEIDASGSVIRERLSQNLVDSSSFGPPLQNLFQLGFDASWELDFWGRLRSLKNAAFYDLEASWENCRNVYITLLAELSRTYAFYRALQQRIDLTLRQIDFAKEQLLLSEVRNRAGLRSTIEPLEVEAQLQALQASLPPLESDLKQTLYAIAVLTGRQPESIPEEWTGRMPIPQARGKIPVGIPSDLLRRRPDIRQAERQLAAAVSRIGAAVAELFPAFSLTASLGAQSSQASNLFTKGSETWSVGPAMFWPFIDFGRIRSRIDFQKAVEKESLWNYEQTVLKALEEVESALAAYAKEEARLASLGAQVESLKLSRDLVYVKYNAGLVSLSEALDAEQQTLFAEQSLLTSEQTLSENLMAVYKSLGGDWTCCSTP